MLFFVFGVSIRLIDLVMEFAGFVVGLIGGGGSGV